jgi:hypothetical protein
MSGPRGDGILFDVSILQKYRYSVALDIPAVMPEPHMT